MALSFDATVSVGHIMTAVAMLGGGGATALAIFKFVWTLDKRIDVQDIQIKNQSKQFADSLELTNTKLIGLLELRGSKIDGLAEDMTDLKADIKELNKLSKAHTAVLEMVNALRRDHDVLRSEVLGLRRGEGFIVEPPSRRIASAEGADN